MNPKEKRKKRKRRHARIRGKIFGTDKRPRLCIFRSNQHIYAQLIDDNKRKVIASMSDLKLKKKKTDQKDEKGKSLKGKQAKSYEVGKLIAKEAKKLKITEVVFDRGGYKYHGQIKSLAEGAREQGLKF